MVSAKNKANWEKGFGNWVVESGLTEEKVSDNDRMYLCYRFKINSPFEKERRLEKDVQRYTNQCLMLQNLTGVVTFPGACRLLSTCVEALNRAVCGVG